MSCAVAESLSDLRADLMVKKDAGSEVFLKNWNLTRA
jgi:hypothetical protein